MSVNLAPGPFGVGGQFVDLNGRPLNGGLIYTYAAGTTTPQPTFTTIVGGTPNANPITLSANGILPQEMWLTAGIAYKILVTDSVGNVIYPYTMDNLSGINDFSSIPTGSEWIASGLTSTFVSASSFTVPGDQTVTGSGFFTAKRRLFVMETAGTIYGVVTSSSVTSSVTTVNVAMDGGVVIDSGISAVSYGLLDSINPSIPQYLVAGTNISIPYTNGIPTINSTLTVPVPRSYLAGLGMFTAGSSATMTVAPGQAADSTNTALMSLLLSTNKTTSAWTVGSGVGGLDTGSIANTTWYHFYEIERVDTGIVDVIFSLSATSPALPTNYTLFRRIGAGLTNSSAQWVQFVQQGDFFEWFTPVLESTSATPGTSAVTQTLANVPTGINVRAFLNAFASASSTNAYISDLATSDLAPSTSVAPLASVGTPASTGSAAQVLVRTNTSAQIRTRNTSNAQFFLATLGWYDSRGKDN